MSSIDLVLLGMLIEQPRSAYDLQKDAVAHHFARWTRISSPSVYKKVLRLREQGYLTSELVRGEKMADKAVYSVTDAGRAYFVQLMRECAMRQVSFLFDFNVVIANLDKVDERSAEELLSQLRESIVASARSSGEYAVQHKETPLVGRTIFEQQRLLYIALLNWLGDFEKEFWGTAPWPTEAQSDAQTAKA